jgi:hypothetical protein
MNSFTISNGAHLAASKKVIVAYYLRVPKGLAAEVYQ